MRQTVNKIRNYFKKDVYKNVLILFSGSTISQAIPFIATIVLTRLFTKDQFGVFFIYSSLCAVFSIVISLRLELSIILPSKQEHGKILYLTSLFTSLILSSLLFVIISFFYNPITEILAEKNIGKILYLLPASLFFLGVTQSSSYWLNRNNNFKDISVVRIIKSSTSSIIQITLGFLTFLNSGLIAGLITGQIVSAVYSLKASFKSKGKIFKKDIISTSRDLLKKYKDIPVFNTSISIANTLSNHLPVFLLTAFYNLEMTAFYGLAHRVIATPMGLVSQSVGEVLYNEASKRNKLGQNLRSLVLSTYKKLFKMAVIPSIIIFLVAPYLFSFLFGSDWKVAGTFTQFLIPWLFIGFLNRPLTYLITILNKQRQILIYETLLLIFRFLSVYLGYYFFNNVKYSVLFFSLTGVLFNVFLLFYIIKISGKANLKYA